MVKQWNILINDSPHDSTMENKNKMVCTVKQQKI